MDYVDMGKRVRKQRQLIGLTQQELAERIGVSTSFVGHVERGTRKASLETLVALSNALGVGVDYLLAGSLQSSPTRKTPPAPWTPIAAWSFVKSSAPCRSISPTGARTNKAVKRAYRVPHLAWSRVRQACPSDRRRP